MFTFWTSFITFNLYSWLQYFLEFIKCPCFFFSAYVGNQFRLNTNWIDFNPFPINAMQLNYSTNKRRYSQNLVRTTPSLLCRVSAKFRWPHAAFSDVPSSQMPVRRGNQNQLTQATPWDSNFSLYENDVRWEGNYVLCCR